MAKDVVSYVEMWWKARSHEIFTIINILLPFLFIAMNQIDDHLFA